MILQIDLSNSQSCNFRGIDLINNVKFVLSEGNKINLFWKVPTKVDWYFSGKREYLAMIKYLSVWTSQQNTFFTNSWLFSFPIDFDRI